MTDGSVSAVTIDFLDSELANDVRASLNAGIEAGAVFTNNGPPDELFRAAVRRAIKSIESKDRGDLLPRFLSVGPYIDSGPIPTDAASQYMGDDEAAAAIRFIFLSAVNCFQGELAEILAVGPVVRLGDEIAGQEGATGSARVFVGDTVFARGLHRHTWSKTGDFHLLKVGVASDGHIRLAVLGVVEVKSYITSAKRLQPQLGRHVERASLGLRIQDDEIGSERIDIGRDAGGPAQIAVVPATWKLPRRFWFDKEGERFFLVVERPIPPDAEDRVERLGANRWQVTLRWSAEALADAAYEMTFWYMGELGRLLYERNGVPPGWSEMTPDQAGQNAVKMMLYYSILRARTGREASRATALYNSYGFGYALGSNFVDRQGRREVLFFEDLHEILATGRSRTVAIDENHPAQWCRIRG